MARMVYSPDKKTLSEIRTIESEIEWREKHIRSFEQNIKGNQSAISLHRGQKSYRDMLRQQIDNYRKVIADDKDKIKKLKERKRNLEKGL